jgi:lipid-binding SYLF domain-containing protein
MKKIITALVLVSALASLTGRAVADEFDDTVALFRNAGQSADFFKSSYGYAVFPTIGKGAVGIGGAHGEGRVYDHGKYVGNTSMSQLSLGLQLGGQAFSQLIFFQDERSFREFTSGNYEFGAQSSAIAITAGASANAGTTGANAGASETKKEASTASSYYKGMAVFTIAKGGFMFEAALSGQKFTYVPVQSP